MVEGTTGVRLDGTAGGLARTGADLTLTWWGLLLLLAGLALRRVRRTTLAG